MNTKQKFMAMRDLAYEIDNDMDHHDRLSLGQTLDLDNSIRALITLRKRHGSKHAPLKYMPTLEAAE